MRYGLDAYGCRSVAPQSHHPWQDPARAKVHNALGLLLRRFDDVDGAIAAFHAAIEHAPSPVNTTTQRAQ